MKVLVTGAAGQVGCRLVRQLLDNNHEIRGTILPDDPCRDRLEGVDIELTEGDLTDPVFVVRAVEGVDAVIHTANYVGPHYENNVQTTMEVTRACADRADSLDRYIYVSSSAVFPNDGHALACAYHPVDELHPKRPNSEYALSKLIGEEMTEMQALRTGLRTVIVRPSHVLSGTAIFKQLSVSRVLAMLRAGLSPASELYTENGEDLIRQVQDAAEDNDQPCSACDMDGRPWYYQPNDARDMAHCIVCALESPAAIGESFNAGAPAPFLLTEGAKMLAEITGRKILEVKLPVRWRYDHDITKAKTWIGYQPKGDLKAMLTSAKAVQDGGYQDYTWDGI